MRTITPARHGVIRHRAAAHPTQLPYPRVVLEEQRAFRVEQLSTLTADAHRRPGLDVRDPRDEVAQALRVAATTALVEIEAAIARLDAGTYGACENCKHPIPPERLEVLPMAALCMQCARAHQQRSR